MEHTVHQGKAFLAIHRRCGYAQPLEIVQDIRLDTVQTRLCRFDMGSFHAEGQILGLDKAVVATGKLVAEHLCIFLSNIVEIIALGRNDDALAVGILIGRHVHEGKLELDGAIEIVQEVTPAFKDRGLILVLVQLVIDILELDGFGEIAGFHAADAIRPHSFKRNTVLRGLLLFVLLLSSCDCGLDLLLFRPRELSLG